jgi:hypothetical protein
MNYCNDQIATNLNYMISANTQSTIPSKQATKTSTASKRVWTITETKKTETSKMKTTETASNYLNNFNTTKNLTNFKNGSTRNLVTNLFVYYLLIAFKLFISNLF